MDVSQGQAERIATPLQSAQLERVEHSSDEFIRFWFLVSIGGWRFISTLAEWS